MATELKERYGAYAEKAKGLEFARDYLEKQLLAGSDSRIMVEQLQKIYSQLNLPEDEFEQLKKQYVEAAAKKDREEIIEKYGDIQAMDFTLTNLDGENVTLSDFEGKVVLLYFGYTYCPDVCPIHLTLISAALRWLCGVASIPSSVPSHS